MIDADKKMMDSINALPHSDNWNPNDPRSWSPMESAADNALKLFQIKQIYVNYPGWVNSSDPSLPTPQGDPFTGQAWGGQNLNDPL